MCPCQPLDNLNIHPPPLLPGFNIGGFLPQLPTIDFPFPNLPFEDLLDLFNTLGMILPTGPMKPHLSASFSKNVLDAIQSLLEKFMPFLMLYKFILPILNLILCIIEVLCALLNPFKLIKALIRLFRVCIPEFLAIFPYLAIIIMIISLLLLILALILYLIERLIRLILIIIQNIINLTVAVNTGNVDSIIAITAKIGDLLCLLQNLFALFGVILVIIQLIKSILGFSFRIPPCDDDNGGDDGCCTTDFCPSFIRNNDTIPSVPDSTLTGNLLYFNEIGIDSGLTLPPGFPKIFSTIRRESWQFYDPTLVQDKAFINIIRAFDLPVGITRIFFPAGVVYDKTTSPSATPYIVSMRLFYDPIRFGKTDPVDLAKGARFIKIKNAIVQSPPTVGLSAFDGSVVAPFNGVLNLVGGVVTEDDGTPILDNLGSTVPINDFLHSITNFTGPTPFPTDGILFSNVSYTFTINHEILVGNSLITLGCVPELALNKNFINTTIGAQANANIAALAGVSALLPDMDAAQQCIINAVTAFRQNISVESANTFQATVLGCLNNLQDQTTTALTAAINAGFDQYNSDFTIDPVIQFTTSPITVTVNLREGTKTLMTANLPSTVGSNIASQIVPNITLGQISPFVYDGYQFFTAEITSKVPGNGNIRVSFNNQLMSTINNPTDLTKAASVTVNVLDYTFVKSSALPSGEPRRDDGDTARDDVDNNGG